MSICSPWKNTAGRTNKPRNRQMDLLEREAFDRWVEYTKRTNFDGIDWPTWRDAYNAGVIH